MILDYAIYVTASCACSRKRGFWASNTHPEGRRWIAELQGDAPCKNRKSLLLRGVIAALSDLEQECNIQLFVDDPFLVDTMSEIVLGLSPQSAAGIGDSALERLLEQLDRHNIVLCYFSDDDKKAIAVRQRLYEL